MVGEQWQLALLSTQIVVAHSVAALCTEATFRLDGFTFTWWFVSCHFTVFSICALVRQLCTGGPGGLVALLSVSQLPHAPLPVRGLGTVHSPPVLNYIICGAGVAISHGCGAAAMNYLSFTTTVLFKSAKVPATLIAGYLLGQNTSSVELLLAVTMATGLFIFGIAERYDSPKFAGAAVVLIIVNLVMSSLNATMQQLMLQSEGTSTPRLKDVATGCCGSTGLAADRLCFWQYAMAASMSLGWCVFSGELSEAIAWYDLNGWQLLWLIIADSFFTYIGLLAIFNISALFDATRASVVCSSRKQLTFVLSYLIYSKPFRALHAVGLVLTLGAGFLLQRHGKAHHRVGASPKITAKSPSSKSPVKSLNSGEGEQIAC